MTAYTTTVHGAPHTGRIVTVDSRVWESGVLHLPDPPIYSTRDVFLRERNETSGYQSYVLLKIIMPWNGCFDWCYYMWVLPSSTLAQVKEEIHFSDCYVERYYSLLGKYKELMT